MSEQKTKTQLRAEVKSVFDELNALRFDKDRPNDVTVEDYVKERYAMDFDSYLYSMGINPRIDSVSNILNQAEVDQIRWIVPEIFRSALRKGYRKAPIWPNIIRSEEQMTGPVMKVPYINMSDAAPRKVNEGETIPLGAISFGQKEFTLFKVGRGISLTDEIKMYSTLNLVSIFLEDFGVLLGHAIDGLAINCLINGEQKDGSEAAPVIGINKGGSDIQYRDLLRVLVRMARLGRTPSTMLGGEDMALDILALPEFSQRESGTTRANLDIKTPIPQNLDFFIHGAIDYDQVIMLDKAAGLLKLNGFPLKVESERIVSNQTEAFYASLQVGFAKLWRDSTVILDRSLNFSDNGFPEYMNVDVHQIVDLKN